MEFNKETFEKALKANKIIRYQRNFEDVVKSYLEIENQALRQTDVSGAVALLKFLKEEQQKKYADAKDYMTTNQHQYYEEGCDAVLQLIEMRFGN